MQSKNSTGVLRGGDPVWYVIYFHLCTKYEPICSFNTFGTCRHPYYVQKTYITTYEFHFQLAFPRRVRSVGFSRRKAGRDVITEFPRTPPPAGASIIYFGRSPWRRPCLVHYLLSFPYEYELICSFNTFCTRICLFTYIKRTKPRMNFIFSLHSPGESGPWDSPGVRQGVTSLRSFPAARRSVCYIFRAFSEAETLFRT